MFAKMAKGKSNLPPRGTGLSTGRAGTRRYGNPRTDEEREERHARIRRAERGWESQLGIRGKAKRYDSGDFEVIADSDPRVAYRFVSKDGEVDARIFWEPGDVEMRGLVGEIGTIQATYPLASGKGSPPPSREFLRSLVTRLNRGQYDKGKAGSKPVKRVNQKKAREMFLTDQYKFLNLHFGSQKADRAQAQKLAGGKQVYEAPNGLLLWRK